MTTLEDRQRVEIQRCLDSLDRQFREWRARVETATWATHYSQVHAATAMLQGLRESIPNLAKNKPNRIEALVLSTWRVWEAFRSRLGQRQEEMFREGLAAADEFAWICRKPLADAFAAANRAYPVEPPLSCLHGSTSPSALVRHRIFGDESGASEPLAPHAAALLKDLPVPFISLPWHELFHAPSMVAIAHETGHVVEADFQLTESIKAAIDGALPNAAERTRWGLWHAEIFADFFAMRHCAHAFAGMLADLLLGHLNSAASDSYPPFELRVELCLAALENVGLNTEAQEIRDVWVKNGGTPVSEKDAELADQVVAALAVMQVFPKGKTLGQLIPMGPEQRDAILDIKKYLSIDDPKDELVQKHCPFIAAAVWLLFRDDPSQFASESQSIEIHGLIMRIAGPGSRRGSRTLADIRRRRGSSTTRPDSAYKSVREQGHKLAAKYLAGTVSSAKPIRRKKRQA